MISISNSATSSTVNLVPIEEDIATLQLDVATINLDLINVNSNINTLQIGKQDTIIDGSLTIARTAGLQASLDSKKTMNPTYGYIHDIVNKGDLGTTLTDLILSNSDIGKYIRFTTQRDRNVLLPDVATLPNGVWVGISCRSIGSTPFIISIRTSSGTLLGRFNGNNDSYGNGRSAIVIDSAWVAMDH
jgi:hypothetical protein